MTAPSTVSKHFVRFFSPGTFVAESNEREIDSWNVDQARTMADEIVQRYNATPYGFQFITRSRGPEDLDSKITETSCMYYLPHCKVETLAEIEARADVHPYDEQEKILRSNMRANGYDRIVTTTKGWRWTQPLNENDVVLT